MSVFTVPKDKQEISVHFEQGVSSGGMIFLERYPEERSIHSKLSAFLEEPTSFFPFLVTEKNTTELLNKKQIRAIEIDYADKYLEISFMHIEDITVFFKDGSVISGTLLTDAPAALSRLSDCLNFPDKFITVKTGDRLFYINKEMILKVVSR